MLFFGPVQEYTTVLRSEGSMNITLSNGAILLVFSDIDVQPKHTADRNNKGQKHPTA
jgi:hypothetical protein